MAHERDCTVCGKQYKYCPKCSQYDGMEKWHVEYCSEQCKNTYSTINKYAFKHIDKDQAKMLLEGNGISKDTIILPRWQKFIDEIFKVEEKVIEKTEPKVQAKSTTKSTAKSSKTTAKKSIRRKKDIVNED